MLRRFARLVRLPFHDRTSVAPFRNRLEDFERLDWYVLQHGAIALYHRRAFFDADRARLAALAYRITDLDAAAWESAATFHEGVKDALSLPGHYRRNLASFVDALTELRVPEDAGVALAIRHYDAFVRREPALASAVLEAIESASRHHLLFGRRFLALIQSDDASLRFAPVGARPIVLNARESAAKTRAAEPAPE